MDFEKAYKELLKGKKIRRKEWETLMHLALDKNNKVKAYKGEYTHFDDNADIILSKGWMVINDDNKELTFLEALQALKEKQKITKREWIENKKDQFVFIDHGQFAMCRSVEYDFLPTWQCFCANDWEILK